MSKKVSSKVSTVSTDNENISTDSKRGEKRAAPTTSEGQIKKLMTDHSSAKPTDQPKFYTATEIAMNARANVQMMPEISDEELLEMAIKFEKEHPQ